MQTAATGELGQSREKPHSPDRAVAIIGMACVEPGAPDAETFWSNIVDGVDSISEVPPSRWRTDVHYDPAASEPDRADGHPADGLPMSVSKWGGFIPDIGFDPMAWGIPPASLSSIDPAQLLALHVAAAALDDAGYGQGDGDREFDRTAASVIFATGSGGAVEGPAAIALRVLLRSHGVSELPPELDAFLPQVTPEGLPGSLTSIIAGRVANRLDLGGKNLTIDSACASVLVGLDIACSELAAGSSDMVLCGGVDLHNGAQDYLGFSAAGALSPRGRCHAFDADADGMTLAEGAACLVLKRLADAERDGDRIYAVVRGVAGSSDGRHLGLTAPRREGQVRAVRRAYAAAGLSPAEVGLVEAHGTGTATGDRTELETITEIFTEAGAEPGSVVLGASKSNIGHTKCASAAASLIKAAKAAYHGVLPPTLHITRPNEVWDPETSPFVFLDRARPWLAERRLVGVSAFGFGGTNFHAILENHRSADPAGRSTTEPTSGRSHWPAELVALRAATPADLEERMAQLSDRLDAALVEARQADRWRLRDLAAAENATGSGPVRLTVVASDLEDLADKLSQARSGRATDGVYRANPADLAAVSDGGTATRQPHGESSPAVAFLVPGVDAVRLGMSADLLVEFPAARAAAGGTKSPQGVTDDDRAQQPARLAEVIMPPQAFTDEDRAQQHARLAEVAEPALAVSCSAVTQILVRLGVAPVTALGPGSPLRPGQPAAFEQEVRELAENGVRVFVEVGPGRELTAMVDRILDGQPHLAVTTDRPGEHGVVGLLHALAQLAVAGIPLDLGALHAGRGCRPDRWLQPGRLPGWMTNGFCTRTASGDSLPQGLRPADQAPPVRVLGAGDPVPVPAAGAGPAASGQANGSGPGDGGPTPGEMVAVTEYLRMVQGIIAAGSDIIRSQVDPNGAGGARSDHGRPG